MTAEIEVCVMQLPSRELLHISLPSEEGGDTITMERFVSLMEEQLSKTPRPIWVHLMVGERSIRRHSDYTRPLHYFLLDNCPWYVHTVESLNTEDGVTIEFPSEGRKLILHGCVTVYDVMKEVEIREGIPFDHQRIFCLRSVQHAQYDHLCPDDGIPVEGKLYLFLRQVGGGCYPGVLFADVMDPAGPEKIQWSKSAPRWREAAPGLCLEGDCTNKQCKAYGRMVIMNKRYTEFDLMNDGHTCQCPICEEHVVPDTCGFNNCQWKVVGRKIEKRDQQPVTFRTEWKLAEDAYECFSPDKNGTANFLDLKILCKKTRSRIVCIVCMQIYEECGEEAAAACGHTFHSDCCSGARVAASNSDDCIECVARRTMTNYQKLFA